MPRNPGTGVYTKPAPDVVSGTTVESKVYNDFVNDVELDLNTPRPIIAGGTGADDAAEARDNLDAEVSHQQVTNYDTHVFEAGSFYSNPGATGEPVAGKFVSGICHFNTVGSIVLEASVFQMDADPTIAKFVARYRRVKWVTWQPWTKLDDDFVNTTGDTMTGPLIAAVKGNHFGTAAGTAATGSVTQVDANILLYNNGPANWAGMGVDGAGVFWIRTGLSGGPAPALRIDPSQNVSVINDPTAAGHVASKNYVDTQTIATKNYVDTTTVSLTGDTMSGPLTMTGNLTVQNAGPELALINTPAGQATITGYRNTTAFPRWRISMPGADPETGNAAGANFYLQSFDDGGVVLGVAVTITRSNRNFAVAAAALKPGGGPWTDSSDIRIKTVLGEYKHGLAELQQVLPVRYTFKGNVQMSDPAKDTLADPSHKAVLEKEFVGVVAQDIEKPMPETVTRTSGYIDGQKVDDLRVLDANAITYALINAVKELAARIEALEAKVPV